MILMLLKLLIKKILILILLYDLRSFIIFKDQIEVLVIGKEAGGAILIYLLIFFMLLIKSKKQIIQLMKMQFLNLYLI